MEWSLIKVNGKQSIYNLNRKDLFEWAKAKSISSFYALKIWENLYRKKITSFPEMSDLKLDIINILDQSFYFNHLELVEVQESSDDTVKFLLKLEDESLIESVLMDHKFGKSVCVTTQIGCNIGCNFCASGLKPKMRDLEVYEIISQILRVQDYLDKKTKEKITHVVVMGIGEPFDNYDNVMKFLSIINDDRAFAIGSRHITVSTSGLSPKILDFAKEDIRANLALSLHAPNNKLRSQLMRINNVYPIESIFAALKEYIQITNKRVTFEYIMIKDFNDSLKEAKELVDLIEPIKKFAYVNLIPYNPVFETGYERSSESSMNSFFDFLSKHKIRCVMRREHGSHIDAACGQLRSRYIK